MKKMITGDHHLVKNLNSQIVLNLIRERGPIYGADLAKITGMQSSTIMNILKRLQKKGLIVKAGIGSSTLQGGRKPTLWEICASYGYVIGIKIEINEVQGVLMDIRSRILEKFALPSSRLQDTDTLIAKVRQIIDQLLSRRKTSHKNVLGLGIGVSGAVDYINGIVLKSAALKETPVPLRSILQQHYAFPIFIENDANAAVLCEHWLGKAQAVSNLVYALLVIDQNVFGIGYGLFLNNHIYRGAQMCAGETRSHDITIASLLSQISGEDHENVLLCGQSLAKHQLTMDHLLTAVAQQDPIALCYFQELGRILGEELAAVVDLIDPQLILLAGAVTQAGEYLLQPIRQTIAKSSILGDIRTAKVDLAADLAADAVAIGAASLLLQDIYKDPFM